MDLGKFVFADTSALIARFLEADSHHRSAETEARRILRGGRTFLSSNFIFDEVVTRVRRRAGFFDSKRVGEALLASRLIRWVFIDADLEAVSWRLYLKSRDQELSFTDASSFAVMDHFGLEEAFTYDADFEKVGFRALPGRS